MIYINQLASAVQRFFWQHKLLLVQSLKEGQQLIEALTREGAAWKNLRPITPLELALEFIQPDMQQRGLELIKPDQLLFIMNQIISDLELRGEIIYYRKSLEKGELNQVIVTCIPELRLAGVEAASLFSEQIGNTQKEREIGLILNAYDLELESRGLMDAAAVYQRATGLFLNDINLLEGKVVLISKSLHLSPMASHFVNQLKKGTGIILGEDFLEY